jgi:hypothetical protein
VTRRIICRLEKAFLDAMKHILSPCSCSNVSDTNADEKAYFV